MQRIACSVILTVLFLFAFGSMVDQVEELVELRGDDNLRATVALLADFRVIIADGIELTPAGSGEA